MKSIDLSHGAPAVAELLDQACDEGLLVRSADGREFIIVAVDDFDEEVMRTRGNAELMEFLEQRAKDPCRIPLRDVKEQLGL